MTAEITEIFENKLNIPGSEVSRSLVSPSPSEDSIIWREDGIRAKVANLESQIADLQGVISRLLSTPTCIDLDPCPSVTATTFYETAPDGTLRTGVEVTVESLNMAEVALLGTPGIAYASKDSNVRSDIPDTNYGTGTNLTAGVPSAGAVIRGWMQFAWGTWGATPTGLYAVEPLLAFLRICKNGTYEHDGLEIALRAEDFDGSDWIESGAGSITWNNQPDLEDINRTLDYIINATTDTYHHFDITKFFYRVREAKSGPWSGTPYGLTICQRDESTVDSRVSFYSKEGASTDAQKPQIIYWEKAEKTALLGPTVKSIKFYGSPGTTYYLVHRALDANNNPGKWSAPISVTMPSTGATPSTPSTATKEDTLISHLKTICLTTSIPADFSHYHVYIKETASSTVKEFNTRVDRFPYWCPFYYASGGGNYEVKYKIVTRSGVESSYSSNLTFSVTSNLKIQSPNGDNWLSLIDTYALGATVLAMPGQVSDFIVEGSDGAYVVRTEKVKSITHDNLLHSCGQASNNSSQNITGTSWTDRTTGSITLTPPGSGNAYYLLIARATVSKGTSTGIRLSFKVDGTQTDDEEAWASADVYETVTYMRRVAVTAGSSHTFKIVAKAADANTAIIGRSNIVALHLGNY